MKAFIGVKMRVLLTIRLGADFALPGSREHGRKISRRYLEGFIIMSQVYRCAE
jgi:hypothetical protein